MAIFKIMINKEVTKITTVGEKYIKFFLIKFFEIVKKRNRYFYLSSEKYIYAYSNILHEV